ncbi:T9SS C-terminal target domain-containing protein [Chitinophaga silvatica]|uniref:T9SS C-terminal target domain-containing protein n=1 Tax=Chitinophaga silvatica TaxID=2282649 RepID=A0A3E1Y4K9_9BACT|nr:putative Ig domain-containing protein [Chitinophaga silvatica]RFS19562.1 T9SS C-terminal target domain-containing protein [Chitinophaga silvatica]
MIRTLRFLMLLLLVWCYIPTHAQSALNSNDPVITYDPANPPASPVFDKITKWVRTVRMGYNTDSYKCYIYKNMAFRLKFPKSYVQGANDGKKYPIYLFFHGVGEAGTTYDNEFHLLWGGQTWMQRVDDGTFDGFLLYPQSQSGYWGTNDYDNLKSVIDSIVTNAKGDPDRLLLNGLSAGGWGTWEFAIRYPQLTAGALPMSAISLDYQNSINNYKFTPIWLFQGGKDGNPAPYTTNTVVSTIQAAGGNIKLTTYPNDEHNTWLDAWNEPDFTPFMLRANRLNPYALFGNTTFCAGESVTIGIAPGFQQYEWQKDQVTIANGTANSIVVTSPGSYRVRALLPSGWTGWSPTPLTLAYKPASPTPVITTSPTLASNVLPAPDGRTSLTLQIPAGMSSYEWLRAGTSGVLSTTNTLTTSTPGAYVARAIATGYCVGSYSDTFRIVNSTGINGPDAISGLVVSSFNKTQINLSWVKNSSQAYSEKYFEVYRATQASGPFTLIGKNNANVVTYNDNGLIPNTAYYYKIRPVNDNAAGPVSAVVQGKTDFDSLPPTAPPSVAVASYTNNQAVLTWQAATDDAGIAGYDIYANNVLVLSVGNVLTGTVTNLTDGTLYNFYVKAKDVSGKTSTPSNQVTIRTKKANLDYKIYNGSWSNLPNFTTLTPVLTGKAYTPDLSVVPSTTTVNYAVMWTGYIKIPVTGTYKFETNSDDGSKLYFNKTYSNSATATVSNDGLHGATFASGTVTNVAAGVYPITVTFFQAGGDAVMEVYWSSTQAGITTRQLIPAEAFVDPNTVTGSAPTAPSALKVTVNNYSKLNLTWTDNSNNETGFEIYRSTSSNGTFNIVATTAANVTAYTDTALNASTAYYYKIRAIGQFGESAFTSTANATTSAKPTPPAAPGTPVTQALSTTVVKVTWADNSTNETGFEVHRSLTDSLHFSFLKSTGPGVSGSGTINDSTLAANTVAWYKVRAVGEGGYSAFTKAVSAKSLNNPPVIDSISNLTIRYGTSQSIRINASDPDNDSLSYSIYNNPGFITVQQSNGITSIVLAPGVNQQGTFNTGVIVTDTNSGADTAFFTVVVNDNYPPVIDSIPAVSVDEGTTKVVKLSLKDLNAGDTFTWTALQLPSFATLQSLNDTCLITLKPGYADAGTYSITVKAVDNRGGTDTRSFVLTVVDKPTPNYKLFLNFQLNSPAPAPWNNISGTTTNNLKDDNGQTTGASLKFDEVWWWAAGVEGATTGNNTGVYPDVVMSQYLYFGSLPGFFSGPTSMTGRISGLETNRTYTVKFFGSSKWWAPSPDNGSTQYTINGVTKSLNVQNNTSNLAVFENIKADSTGQIKFTMSLPTGGQVGYLNALEVDAGGANDTTTNPVNLPPVMSPIANKTVKAGDTLHIQFSATDPENDPITYSGYQLPSFVTVVQGNGSPYLLVQPTTSQAGQYNNIGVIATDNHGNSDTAKFSLTVTSQGADTSGYRVLLNFHLNNPAPAPWNNITGTNTTNLKNEAGQTTSIGLKFDQNWWAAGIEGATTGNNSGVYPDVVLSQYLYFGSLSGFFSGAPVMTGHLSGLDRTKTYSVKFLSNSKWWAPQPDNGSTQFTINGVSQTLYAQNNTSNLVVFSGLVPDANGEIVFTLSIPPGGQVGYLNALELVAGSSTSHPNNPPTITKIADQTVEAGSTLTIPVVASDPDGDPITFTTSNLPSFVTLTTSGSSRSLVISPTTSNSGTYNNLRIIVRDSYGAADTTTFNLTVTQPAGSGGSSKILLNFKLNQTAPAPWNNITGPTANLKNDAGQSTSIGFRFDEVWWWAAGIEGATTGNNSGVYPDVVLSEYLYFGSLPGFFSGVSVMHGHLYGLSPNATYTLKFLSNSKWWAPQPDNGSTQFTVNGVSKTLYAQNNTSNTADFAGLTADANGEIAFTLSIPPGGQVGYLNAMEIDIQDNSSSNLAKLGGTQQSMVVAPATANATKVEATAKLELNVYPNPFTNTLAVDVSLPHEVSGMLFEIVDLTGRKLYSEMRRVPAGRSQQRFNTSGNIKEPGIYLLRVTTNKGETQTIKLMKL